MNEEKPGAPGEDPFLDACEQNSLTPDLVWPIWKAAQADLANRLRERVEQWGRKPNLSSAPVYEQVLRIISEESRR